MIPVDPTRERVQTLLARCAYKPGTGWRVLEKAPGVVLVQHWQILPCAKQPAAGHTRQEQRGRKWYVSEHMTDEEILQTALLAVLTFEEHEAREAFLFDGRRIFGPHKSLSSLAQCTESVRAP